MSITTAEGRNQILDELGSAGERIAEALAHLGDAYEQIDVGAQDRLEDEIFRPLQKAAGLAKRSRTEFAARHGLFATKLASPTSGLPHRPAENIGAALDAAGVASHEIAELQDSMMPTEFGDPPLRAALAEIRALLDSVGRPGRELLSTLGR